MLLDPLKRQGLNTLQVVVGIMLATVSLDLAHLLAHAGTEQGLLVGKGDADQVTLVLFAAPGDITGIAGLFAKCGNVHFDGGAPAEGARMIACHATQADSVQALPVEAVVLEYGQFHRDIGWMRKKAIHEH
ncbi:hypothetical protein D9M73_168110 [compost metagenome]